MSFDYKPCCGNCIHGEKIQDASMPIRCKHPQISGLKEWRYSDDWCMGHRIKKD